MKRNAAGAVGDTWILLFILSFAIACYGYPPIAVPDGYATQNGGTTGGGNATPITVSTVSEFKAAVGDTTPRVIVVNGRLNVGNVQIRSNKTIVGADTSAGLYGGTIRVEGSNYIFQNLTFGPASGDVLEISGATNVFIHKCEFYDSTDELCSIVRQADYITVSWCKFYFSDPDSHSYAHLIGNGDDVIADRGKLHVTLHHNWYAEGVRGRMPRVRFGHVHIYNNYYNSVGSGYCIGVGYECHIRVENTHFHNVSKPWADYGGVSNGYLGWAGLKFEGCSQPTFMPNTFPVFTPPYAYTMDNVNNVRALLTDPVYGAGNRLSAFPDDTTPPTPNPMTWAEVPYSTGGTEIVMTAVTASDPSGVEYYFANLTDPSHDSGWQLSPTYVDTGLNPGTMYTYRVMARDRSINANETGWSDPASATTVAWICTAPIAADLTGDCRVNLDDFSQLAAQWTDDPPPVEFVINGEFETALAPWTHTALSGASGVMTAAFDGAAGNPPGSAFIETDTGTAGANNHRFYQVIPVTVGKDYVFTGQWAGDISGTVATNPSARNWAEVLIGFSNSAAPGDSDFGDIIYKKAYGNGNLNTSTGVWGWESIADSPNGSSAPAGGVFTATAPYMVISFNLGGRADSGVTHFWVDNISVTEILPCAEIDLTGDCMLNLQDLAAFALEWLDCNRNPVAECGL